MSTNLWKEGHSDDEHSVRIWKLSQSCEKFGNKYDMIQEQLEDMCGTDDLLTGVLSKSKGQILRLAAIFNALFGIDAGYETKEYLSDKSIEAAINFVDVCIEHATIIGGKKSTPFCEYYVYMMYCV